MCNEPDECPGVPSCDDCLAGLLCNKGLEDKLTAANVAGDVAGWDGVGRVYPTGAPPGGDVEAAYRAHAQTHLGHGGSSATATSDGVCTVSATTYIHLDVGPSSEWGFHDAGCADGMATACPSVPFQGSGCPLAFETADCTCPVGQGL